MFTSKGFFSEIPCPYQSTCVLPRCLFCHSKSSFRATPNIVQSNDTNTSEGEDRPPKRQKVGNEDPSHKNERPTLADKPEAPCRGDKASKISAKNNSGHQKILSANRPISPPPLRRKSQPSGVQNGDHTMPIKSFGSAPIPTPDTPNIEKKSSIKIPLKQESLNPRALRFPAPTTHAVRYKLVQLLHEQFNRLNSELKSDANDEEEELVLSDQELITRALDLEEKAAATPSIYSNIVKGKIGLYRKMTVPQWKERRAKELAAKKASEVAMSSETPAAKPESPPKIVETGLTPQEELQVLPRLFSSLTGLEKHGYVTAAPTDLDIETARKGIEAAKGWEVCDRCKSRFQVFPGRREKDGALASGGPCNYHFGKPYLPERSLLDSKGTREKRYRCCNQLLGDSTGCVVADCHVFKISEVKRMASVLNFEKTPENFEVSTQPVCIDGEMGYTVHGLELIRLTATSWPSGEELFDVLVKPIGEVMDLNSRFSGVWPKDFADATPWDAPLNSTSRRTAPCPDLRKTPAPAKRPLRIVSSVAVARSLLFTYLSPKTPLIGHGLENDLNAARIIHPTIIDTALLFPHPHGLPYRNGLKALMLKHLNRHIQMLVDGKMEGHDSMEDANAAGELVRFALANEWAKMKRDGWKFEQGILKAPAPKIPVGTSAGPKSLLTRKKRSRDEAELEDGELNY